MKKTLLTWNVIFYAVLYSISLLRWGFVWGESHHASGLGAAALFPAIYLFFLAIGIRFIRENEYCTAKRYYAMAVVTMAFISLVWGIALVSYIQGSMPSATHFDIALYPAILFVISAAISVNYSICAVKTKKENR